MIYFDNAATTKYKPDSVYEGVNFFLREFGVSPGRGSYSIGIDVSRMLYKTRCTVGRYFGMSRSDRVVFTKNSTEAINLLFNGLLNKGDHVIISCYEHNAVLRPLQHLKEKGIVDYSVIKREDLELSAEALYEKYARENTRVLALTLASNLTGRIIFREDWCKYFKDKNIVTFVDSSQGAGKIKISMKEANIDFLAFTGHKDLYAIPGIGGLCCESSIPINPLIQGGTGIHGEEYVNPAIFPEGLEAGTLNMPAIWSLHESLEFLNCNVDCNNKLEAELMHYLMTELKKLNSVIIYDEEFPRVSTCCFNIKNVPSDRVVALLDEKGICVRGGIHCAILAHEAIDTVKTGTVRISLNYFNSIEEINVLIDVLKKLVNKCI